MIENYDHSNTVEYDSQEDKHELLEKKQIIKIQESKKIKNDKKALRQKITKEKKFKGSIVTGEKKLKD